MNAALLAPTRAVGGRIAYSTGLRMRDLTPEIGSGSVVRIRAGSEFGNGGSQDGQEAISSRADHRQVA